MEQVSAPSPRNSRGALTFNEPSMEKDQRASRAAPGSGPSSRLRSARSGNVGLWGLSERISTLRRSSVGGDFREVSLWDTSREVDLARGVKQPHSTDGEGDCAQLYRGLKVDLQALKRTARQEPSVGAWTVLVMVVLMFGGVWAVLAASDREAGYRQELAQQIVNDKALFLETEVANAWQPAYIANLFIQQHPSWTSVNGSLRRMATNLIRNSHAESVLSFNPNG
ncbi:hypothetical protein TSOC_003457 [Tetrabaena socialis]|uniref:Uncharacterized protein n=1 Tax=Tetrabaena socialis TaxID=47790 RepID=A0A2J8ABK4_9CHLO|nr:hypothetical protein TSOC_003457 [Tetrabaena socialis]|eukprot:PNH09900.1 hypothetical protein TSOC_003457 [Tetrabaena socialis]